MTSSKRKEVQDQDLYYFCRTPLFGNLKRNSEHQKKMRVLVEEVGVRQIFRIKVWRTVTYGQNCIVLSV